MLIPADPKAAGAFQCRVIPPVEDDTLGLVMARCAGAQCAHFRLIPKLGSPEWVSAVRKAASDIKDTSYNSVVAIAYLTANPAKYGTPAPPTHGRCGLAGRLEGLLP